MKKILLIILTTATTIVFTSCEDDPILELEKKEDCPPGTSYCKLTFPRQHQGQLYASVSKPSNPKIF